jgi:hypothetical protein
MAEQPTPILVGELLVGVATARRTGARSHPKADQCSSPQWRRQSGQANTSVIVFDEDVGTGQSFVVKCILEMDGK